LLTADLVHARRRGGQLRVVHLDGTRRVRAGELAAAYLAIARSLVGRSRDEFEEACGAVEVEAQERRLADGIRKLVEDRCEFAGPTEHRLAQSDAELSIDPAALRREVFLKASAARQGGIFDRHEIVGEIARQVDLTAEALEAGLYADLRGAHRLRTVAPIAPERLVAEYDLAQLQAVLLRAVRVTVDVQCATPGAYRALFRKLKFLRLLYRIQEAQGGYRIEIDGPFSLFEAVTRYGLQLALALPALSECDAFTLAAEVRWGPDRSPLGFRLEGGRAAGEPGAPAEGRLPDEVAALVEGVRGVDTPWKVAPAGAILDFPGVGLCIPDLVFEHEATGECVYLEVMGFWSREAVWRRVELVEAGLGDKVLFAVSERLRVSEQALDGDLPGALYVYKRVMSARAVLERVERLAAVRAEARPPGREVAR
jgi:predicted nuclease of restriction endonuclease-like RecB superfamily